jgi:inosine-uridine nucleoside N-ribohydrolase
MSSNEKIHTQFFDSERHRNKMPFREMLPVKHSGIYSLLELPKTNVPKHVFIDTDAYNEIDDQFALVHALLAEKLNSELKIVAIGAAPFHNQNRDTSRYTENYAHGMELSYKEIHNILEILDCGWDGPVYRGSTLTISANGSNFVDSDAATGLCDLVNEEYSKTNPLYVLALGALTNIASAIMMDPSIRGKMIVCTLGGLATSLKNFKEFNYRQDLSSAQIVFASGVPIVHFGYSLTEAGFSIADTLKTTQWELEANIKDKGKIGLFLYHRFVELITYFPGRSKTIWDFAPGAWVLNPDWFISEVIPTPLLNEKKMWIQCSDNHPMRTIKWIDRDPIFNHFFNLLSKHVS